MNTNTMNMKYRFKFFLWVLIVVIFSCKQQDGQSERNNDELISEDSNLGYGEEGLDEIYHRFPSPEEMLSILQRDELIFNARILNDPKKATEYLNSKSQALNLGVYSADLAYLTLFEKHKESTLYFEAIYNLSNDLRISSAFDIELLRRVQSNMTNPDSLKALSDFAFGKISNYLVANNKEKIFALISLGGFVEALHLSFNFSEGYSENNVIVQRISDQKLVLENIISYSGPYKDDPAVAEVMEAIVPIRKIYNEIESVKSETVVTKSEDGKIIISGGNKITITHEQFEGLREATIQVRKEITQN